MKNRKIANLALAAVVAVSMCSAVGCGKKETITENTIIVKVFNGGAGVEWIEKVRDEFNKNNEEYQVLLRYDKTMASGIIDEIKQGYPTADCYFSSGNDFQSGIYKNYLEDLSDVLEMEVDGAGNGTIGDKMLKKEQWLKAASKNGEGCYMLPYMDAIFGLVYNHDLFVENGWLTFASGSDKDAVAADGLTVAEEGTKLKFVSSEKYAFYNEGDYILSAGKDGVYGTYDDGQPETEKQFNTMIQKIINGNDNARAFLYNGIYDHYTNNIAEMIAAQYMGLEEFETTFTYDSNGKEIEMYDGTSEVITPATGYRVYKSKGIYEGLRFIKTYMDDQNKVHANSFKTSSYSHTDAQNDFILSFKSSTGYPAILVEGAWWENEARAMFQSVVNDGNPAYGYGKQNFRFMLLPAIDGQKGIDGEGNGSVVNASDAAAVVVPKGLPAGRLAKLKEFIGMTMRNEVLVDFTKTTGIARPYKYTLSDADLMEMTPYQRSAWAIYTDTENVAVITTSLMKNADPLTYTTNITSRSFAVKIATTYTTSYVRALRDAGTLNNLYSNGLVGYTATDWAGFMEQAQLNGFYN